MADEAGIGDGVLGEAAVDRVAGVLLGLAQGLPTAQAVLAVATGAVQPGNPHPIAFLDVVDALTHRGDFADAFMAGNKWRIGLDRPVAVGGVQVGVADPGGGDLDQNLAPGGARHLDLLEGQGLTELTNDGGFHGALHCCAPCPDPGKKGLYPPAIK